MSLLSDYDITKYQGFRMWIDPWDEELIQPASYDVTLDNEFLFFAWQDRGQVIDPKVEQTMKRVVIPVNQPYRIDPGHFALGSTRERVALDRGIASRFEGKSSIGRLGLLVHATAGFIDPGFDGHITLELANLTDRPILLWPGMKIGQLCFFETSTHVLSPYGAERGSNYQGQRGPTASRSYKQFRREAV